MLTLNGYYTMSLERNNQMQRVRTILKTLSPMTMKEIDKYSGIMRENICRYCRVLRQNKELIRVKKRYCTITGHLAYELTLRAEYKPRALQLELEF